MNKSSIKIFQACAIAAALLLPALAQSHIVGGEAPGFWSGARHPLSGLDHIIAMVAVGLWAGQMGRQAIWVLPLTFPALMGAGALLGLAGFGLGSSAEIGIALSGVVLGAAVLLAVQVPVWIAAPTVGLFALFHGYAHGTEMQLGQNPGQFFSGFILSTAMLHALGISIALSQRWTLASLAVRSSGAVVAAVGAFFLWQAI